MNTMRFNAEMTSTADTERMDNSHNFDLDIAQLARISIASDEDVLAVSKRLMQKNQIAYEELAK